jgi:hypothetical protein
MVEARIDQACAHSLGGARAGQYVIEEVLSVLRSLEDEGRCQEDGRLDGTFRQLRIVPVVQHQRFGMEHVIADMGFGRKRFHHGPPRFLK